MFVKTVLVAVLASAAGLSVVGCMSAESAEVATENVTEVAQALTTGLTFDTTALYLNYHVGSTASADMHYYPGLSSVLMEVPCTATQVGVQAIIKYDGTGSTLWPRVLAQVPGLTQVSSDLSSMAQGTTQTFGQNSNLSPSLLTSAASDQTLAVVLTLQSHTSSAYTFAVQSTTMTYYVRRMCSCP